MGQVVNEVKQWNTPIVGAFLLWKFTQGYCAGHRNGDAPVALLHFLAVAILTNRQLLDPINNRRNDLQSYVRSFENDKRSDLLLGIQKRVLDKRNYALASIDMAVSTGLLVWDTENGKLYPREVSKQIGRGVILRTSMGKDGNKAEILGRWFSQHELSTIAAYLEVVF